jgi:protein-S-isoprenylcysteine O-methyltransferase Ste14
VQDVNRDLPVIILAATICTYWFTVGAMVVRARRKTRQLAGLVPVQKVEQMMWLVWVPLVAAWMTLPWLSLTHQSAWLRVPDFADEWTVYAVLRWFAAVCAVVCFALTSQCWARMGKDWSMAITKDRGEMITDGLFSHVRHPIYALSMLLMVCSAIIVATVPMLIVAVVHIVLMNLKARNEERHMLAMHGEGYRQYLRRTGRFLPGAQPPRADV